MLGYMLHESLLNSGDIYNIYDAMGSNDLSDVVLTTLSILRKTGNVPQVKTSVKCEEQSNLLRLVGNEHFDKANYKCAFFMYNEAILNAPKDSKALALAYGNRSALLHKLKKYQECIKDIEKCLSLNYPKNLVAKLEKRKNDAAKILSQRNQPTVPNYFELDSVHSQIPCASNYINVTHEGNKPKIVAASNIPVGTVLVIENPYVSFSEKTSFRACCHFCHKFSLNLLPCEGCTYAYFCSNECRDCCIAEYHKVECLLMDLIKLKLGLYEALMFKAVLKIVLSGTWDELIETSLTLNIGIDKPQKSPINENIDIHKMFSIFNSKDERPFVFGDMYSGSFLCAVLIHYLERIPNFFPCSIRDKEPAIRAVARIMMFIIIYRKPQLIKPAGDNIIQKNMQLINKFRSYGLYPLISNVKKSCQANVIVVSINNRLALVAMRPIQNGMDLTMPNRHSIGMENLCEDLDPDTKFRDAFFLFELQRDVCGCKKCSGKVNPRKSILSETQKKFFEGLNLKAYGHNMSFREVCKALTVLSDAPHSEEFQEIAMLFGRWIVTYQAAESHNFVLDD